MTCEYKEFCDGEGKATHECENCGTKYCDECAETMDYECDCIVYRNIHPIKK